MSSIVYYMTRTSIEVYDWITLKDSSLMELCVPIFTDVLSTPTDVHKSHGSEHWSNSSSLPLSALYKEWAVEDEVRHISRKRVDTQFSFRL